MQQIVLTEDQMKILSQASEVDVCDPTGKVLGTVVSPEFIAEMKRRARAPGPRYSGEQVQGHLRALQEAWDREGPFDRNRMHQILNDIKAAEKS